MTQAPEVLLRLSRILPGDSQPEEDEVGAIAARLLKYVQSDQTSDFPRFFEEVEQNIIFGTEEVRDLMVVGLLENIKNIASLRGIDYSVFEQWLGPETHIAWRWLEKRWKGTQSLADLLHRSKKREDAP